jgi:quinoprotein glucose dehydrogenase
MRLLRLFLFVCLAITGGDMFGLRAAEVGNAPKKAGNDKTPANVSVEDDPQTAMRKMRVTPGLKIELLAAEPLLENAIAFSFDHKGRVYVAETGRRRTSVFDIRSYRDWTDADLGFRTPAERAEFLKQNVSDTNDYFMSALATAKVGNFGDFNKDGRIDWRDLEVETDRIKLLWDSNGDGVADQSTVFADGFNTLVSGLGAGVLVHGGDVYYTCIPDVVRLRDTNGDGKADERKVLHSGFGVHIAYGGHDMHGAAMGPDGRLYWTIADRGFAPPADIKGYGFTTDFLKRVLPDTGAVFRCDPDGANLEVVCVGLRNPQELAWDQFGNLFTVDNNADGGDKARLHYLVEGADYGWRYGWQHLPKLGAWNTEMLWGLASNNTALYSLPPVAHITHGPSGFAYYPGTGLPERFDNHFFIADFPGGVRYFQVKPEGAGFAVDNPGDYLQDNKPDNMAGKLLWNLYPTDLDFPPGGGIAVLDWVFGWEKTGKGRIYRLHDPALATDVATAETKLLLGAGLNGRASGELISLLGHRDQRVRGEAQRELTRRNALAIKIKSQESFTAALLNAARAPGAAVGRVQAAWALRQIVGKDADAVAGLVSVLKDSDEQVRAAAAGVLGAAGARSKASELAAALDDASSRVRLYAAQAVGKLRHADGIPAIVRMLRANADRDPYLRHAGVCALVNIGDQDALREAARDQSATVRLAALLAMRRLEMPELAKFLSDPDPRLVLEAARAINDAPIAAAMPQLAAFLSAPNSQLRSPISEFTARRAINANFRLGQIEHAQRLISFAENTGAPEALRVEALQAVGDWGNPSGRDRVTGLWWPIPKRDGRAAGLPMRFALEGLLKAGPDTVRVAALEAVSKLDRPDVGPILARAATDAASAPEVRVAALRGLAAYKSPELAGALKTARADKSELVRREASRLAGTGDAADAVAALSETLTRGSLAEQQTAYESLATIKGKEADAVIRKALDSLLAGKLRAELALDVIEAAARRASPSIQEKLQAYRTGQGTNELSGWRETLFGGDAADGRKIFYERAEAGCFRCHKVSGEGGDVGPELAGLAAQKGREYLLESILYPNKHIATGFETLNVTMKGGVSHFGMKKAEDERILTLNSPEDGEVRLPKPDIVQRGTGMSAMPEGIGALLTKREVRDLMEFLSTAKPPAK